MNMKIAIHHRPGSFSERWITYCQLKEIDYKIVNAYDSDIIEQVKDCDIFMWHHHHGHYRDVLTAKRILFALEQAGVKVFPNFNTGWHFDDKVAQKYLFEACNIPLAPSWVFYSKKEAISWANSTTFPKVFKLKGGAGAANVKLVKTKSDALKLVNKAFGKGFSKFDRLGNLKERFNKYKHGSDSILGVIKGIGRLFIPTDFAKMQSREKGYIYFQEFIPNDGYDIRIQIANEKAMAMIRFTRPNDFRASGSGNITRLSDLITEDAIKLGFDIVKKLKLQACALDFVRDNRDNKLYVIENSYCFGLDDDEFDYGYWTEDGVHHKDAKFNGLDWMIIDLIDSI